VFAPRRDQEPNPGVTGGLKIWLVTLLVFFAVGYPAGFSIVWGAIAGWAGGFIVYQWSTRNQAPYRRKEGTSSEGGLKGLRARLSLQQQDKRGKNLKEAAERRQSRRTPPSPRKKST
jgi:hypothetical protein